MNVEENENIKQLLAINTTLVQQKQALDWLADYCEESYILNLPPSTGLTGTSSRATVLISRAAGAYRTYAAATLSAVRARLVALLGSSSARFALAFVMTLAVEVPALFLLARFGFKLRSAGDRRTVLVGVLASSLTLPLLWFALHAVASPRDYVFVGEFVVFVVEAVLYRALLGVGIGRAALLSLVTNALSFYVGLMVL